MLLTELYTLNCVQGLANIVSLELTILGTVGAVALPTKTVSSTAPTVPKIVSSTVKKGAERTRPTHVRGRYRSTACPPYKQG